MSGATEPFVTQAEFARLQGWAKSYVTALKKEGRLVMNDGLVDVAASRARILETADPEKAAVAERHAAARAGTADPLAGEDDDDEQVATKRVDYQEAKARKEIANARLAEMEVERESGKLVEAAMISAALADAGATLRSTLSNLPAIVAPMLATLSDETQIRLVLDEHIEQALSDLSQRLRGAWRTKATGAEAA